jgi:hypothetical protein
MVRPAMSQARRKYMPLGDPLRHDWLYDDEIIVFLSRVLKG